MPFVVEKTINSAEEKRSHPCVKFNAFLRKPRGLSLDLRSKYIGRPALIPVCSAPLYMYLNMAAIFEVFFYVPTTVVRAVLNGFFRKKKNGRGKFEACYSFSKVKKKRKEKKKKEEKKET